MIKQMMIAVMAVSLCLLSFAIDEEPSGPKYYDDAKVVRIRYVSGEALVKRSYDEGAEEATVNLPLFENDEVTTTDGRAEIYLGRINYVRLDTDSTVRLARLPMPRKTDATLRIDRGGLYLEIESLDFEKAIEIQTPDCGIFLLDRGRYRINVHENGRTEIFVHQGLAEIAGSDSSRNVRENQKVVMASGEFEQRPYNFYNSERDEFDSWNDQRNRELGSARYGSSRYLQNGYEDYESELSRYGRWTYMNEFSSYCWTPYNLDSGWNPYYNGRWIWHPHFGYVWSSYDPWGWFPHYYGHWQWNNLHGWYWIPSYHWSPAWVYWFWDNDYYGWCPSSRWNTPVIIINGRWDRHYKWHRGIPLRNHSTIVIRKSDITNPHLHREGLSQANADGTLSRTLGFHGSSLTERPVFNKVTVVNSAGRSVQFKQNALVNPSRYTQQGEVYKRTDTSAAGVSKYSGTGEIRRSTRTYSGQSAEVKRQGSSDSGTSNTSSGIVRKKNESTSDSETRTRSSSGESGSSRDTTVKSRGNDQSSGEANKKSDSSSTSTGTVKKKKDEQASNGYGNVSYRGNPESGYGEAGKYSSRNSRNYGEPSTVRKYSGDDSAYRSRTIKQNSTTYSGTRRNDTSGNTGVARTQEYGSRGSANSGEATRRSYPSSGSYSQPSVGRSQGHSSSGSSYSAPSVSRSQGSSSGSSGSSSRSSSSGQSGSSSHSSGSSSGSVKKKG